ncbi:hypothetical protein [Hominenteromicrobium sp.]|uniref:hypothetical protein n=1 Tax=Hominenteromicrobium sp. TaxID=3073581 RepID=UPI003AB5CC20
MDRNFHGFHRFSAADWSPSTRRAWIEIPESWNQSGRLTVALHPEGVDRNSQSDIETLFKN